jgi:hypothetical protein
MKIFQNKFGPIPFWFWNGKQDEKEISRQLELAARGGVRGMVVHARKGNQIEYMSERWLDLFRHTCFEARRLSLEIWLYDEEGCPSGTVGERLPAQGEKYQQKALKFAYMTAQQACASENVSQGFRSEDLLVPRKSAELEGKLVRVFRANDLHNPVDPVDLPVDTEVLVFSKIYISDYIDALSRETLDEFLSMTHEIYWQELKEFFGDPVTAVYTDDLNHLLVYGDDIPYLSYTDTLEAIFQNKHGYSILDKLPHLVENLPGCGKVRCDYRHTVMQMFLENYVEPMHQWCKRHNVTLTGHLSGDEGNMRTSICRFSAAMPFYEHEDIPGIDDFLAGMADNGYLRKPFNELGFSAIVLCKQASSVANQLKDRLCSSEVLTSLGWGVPVSRQMAQIRFQQGLGINVIVPHDFSYSTAGITKRDHPASYFFQQPWFHENHELYNAVARTSKLISRGQCAAKVAVLNPVTSGWVALDGEQLSSGFSCRHPSPLPDITFIEKGLAEISLHLLQHHIDFEYVDEELLSKHGEVSKSLLKVGAGAYKTLLLPPMINIQKSTVELLKDFTAEGGRIIQVGERATHIDGRPQNNIFDFPVNNYCLNTLASAITPQLDFISTDDSSKEVLLHSRMADGHLEYFLTNFSEHKQELRIISKLNDYVLYDPESARIVRDNGSFPTTFTMRPLACCHILPEAVLKAASIDISETIFAPSQNSSEQKLVIEPTLDIMPENENVLLLDAGFLDSGQQVLFADSDNLPAGTRITVPVNIPEPDKVSAVYMENPEQLNMTINGKFLTWTNKHHSATQDLRMAPISGMLYTGNNEFVFLTSGKRTENFYLTGNFGVHLLENPNGCRAELTEQSLALGDASQQGLPFYWGSLKYDIHFPLDEITEDIWLNLGKVEGVLRLTINGKDAGLRYNSPWSFNLKGMLLKGKNHIGIRLYNTAQNFFGPHRAEKIFGSERSWEGSSHAAWTPKLSGTHPDSWGVAGFGIYGPINFFKKVAN